MKVVTLVAVMVGRKDSFVVVLKVEKTAELTAIEKVRLKASKMAYRKAERRVDQTVRQRVVRWENELAVKMVDEMAVYWVASSEDKLAAWMVVMKAVTRGEKRAVYLVDATVQSME